MYIQLDNEICIIPEIPAVEIADDNDGRVVRIIALLLGQDYINVYKVEDVEIGFPPLQLPKSAKLAIDSDSMILGENGAIKTLGNVPLFHCIQYLSKGSLRSIAVSTSKEKPFTSPTLVYSNELTHVMWEKISQYVNLYVGADFVRIDFDSEEKLVFDYSCTSEYTEKELKFIYMFISECVVTPNDRERILLFNQLDDILTRDHWVSFINYVCTLPRHRICILSNVGLGYADINDLQLVHFLKN